MNLEEAKQKLRLLLDQANDRADLTISVPDSEGHLGRTR